MMSNGDNHKAIKFLAVFALMFLAIGLVYWKSDFVHSGSTKIFHVTADIDAWRVVFAGDTTALASMDPLEASAETTAPDVEPASVAIHTDVVSAPVPSGAPVRITIPSIYVDASVMQVTLAADGSMGVPKLPLDAGWYALGPRPGETGSAVIAGHVDWYGGVTGVFAKLDQVKLGDSIVVRGDDGTDVSFVVRDIRSYKAGEDATDVFVSIDGKAHLNLVTCGGTWDKSTKQYTDRLVVFTDKILE